MYISTGWGPQIAKLPYKWLNSMVYGRYNELVNGVHKPTNITWGAPSCMYLEVSHSNLAAMVGGCEILRHQKDGGKNL
jgi:hypothetical protein